MSNFNKAHCERLIEEAAALRQKHASLFALQRARSSAAIERHLAMFGTALQKLSESKATVDSCLAQMGPELCNNVHCSIKEAEDCCRDLSHELRAQQEASTTDPASMEQTIEADDSAINALRQRCDLLEGELKRYILASRHLSDVLFYIQRYVIQVMRERVLWQSRIGLNPAELAEKVEGGSFIALCGRLVDAMSLGESPSVIKHRGFETTAALVRELMLASQTALEERGESASAAGSPSPSSRPQSAGVSTPSASPLEATTTTVEYRSEHGKLLRDVRGAAPLHVALKSDGKLEMTPPGRRRRPGCCDLRTIDEVGVAALAAPPLPPLTPTVAGAVAFVPPPVMPKFGHEGHGVLDTVQDVARDHAARVKYQMDRDRGLQHEALAQHREELLPTRHTVVDGHLDLVCCGERAWEAKGRDESRWITPREELSLLKSILSVVSGDDSINLIGALERSRKKMQNFVSSLNMNSSHRLSALRESLAKLRTAAKSLATIDLSEHSVALHKILRERVEAESSAKAAQLASAALAQNQAAQHQLFESSIKRRSSLTASQRALEGAELGRGRGALSGRGRGGGRAAPTGPADSQPSTPAAQAVIPPKPPAAPMDRPEWLDPAAMTAASPAPDAAVDDGSVRSPTRRFGGLSAAGTMGATIAVSPTGSSADPKASGVVNATLPNPALGSSIRGISKVVLLGSTENPKVSDEVPNAPNAGRVTAASTPGLEMGTIVSCDGADDLELRQQLDEVIKERNSLQEALAESAPYDIRRLVSVADVPAQVRLVSPDGAILDLSPGQDARELILPEGVKLLVLPALPGTDSLTCLGEALDHSVRNAAPRGNPPALAIGKQLAYTMTTLGAPSINSMHGTDYPNTFGLPAKRAETGQASLHIVNHKPWCKNHYTTAAYSAAPGLEPLRSASGSTKPKTEADTILRPVLNIKSLSEKAGTADKLSLELGPQPTILSGTVDVVQHPHTHSPGYLAELAERDKKRAVKKGLKQGRCPLIQSSAATSCAPTSKSALLAAGLDAGGFTVQVHPRDEALAAVFSATTYSASHDRPWSRQFEVDQKIQHALAITQRLQQGIGTMKSLGGPALSERCDYLTWAQSAEGPRISPPVPPGLPSLRVTCQRCGKGQAPHPPTYNEDLSQLMAEVAEGAVSARTPASSAWQGGDSLAATSTRSVEKKSAQCITVSTEIPASSTPRKPTVSFSMNKAASSDA